MSTDLVAEDAARREQWEAVFDREVLPIINARCVECHSGNEPDGGFDITEFNTGKLVSEQPDVWDRVGKRIRLKEMPPEGSPQLNDQQKGVMHRWLDSRPQQDLCATLATDETQAWYRGYVMSRRLTRTEYLNAIQDLVGLSVDSQLEIPSDGSGGEGFDTAGDALFTSAIHVERYLAVASRVIEEATPGVIPKANDAKSQRAGEARKRILVESPGGEVSEAQAARSIIARFARRAWRRPVTGEELDRLMILFDSAKGRRAEFIVALREPLKAVLVSPNFLFVVEPEAPQGGVQKLTPHQLATRMALFIWSSIPDEALLDAADRGGLDTEQQVIAQVRRMLADDRARSLGENFAMQWLGLTSFLSSVHPDDEVYPEYNAQLAEDLYEEAVRLVATVLREDRSVLELIDADYVHVNGHLADHYGLDLPADAPWQLLAVDDAHRGGVITLGAVLTAASYPRRTSPVLRGRWVLEELLGDQVPPPPPDVPTLEEGQTGDSLSLRQRLEMHRKDPQCAACHNRMDPIGFGLENFDSLGRWRNMVDGVPIDASGKLPSGEAFRGPQQLKEVLLRRSEQFEQHLVKKMLGFALGRELNKFDQCVIEDCLKQLNSNDHRSRGIIETIVTSYPFQHRYFKAAQN